MGDRKVISTIRLTSSGPGRTRPGTGTCLQKRNGNKARETRPGRLRGVTRMCPPTLTSEISGTRVREGRYEDRSWTAAQGAAFLSGGLFQTHAGLSQRAGAGDNRSADRTSDPERPGPTNARPRSSRSPSLPDTSLFDDRSGVLSGRAHVPCAARRASGGLLRIGGRARNVGRPGEIGGPGAGERCRARST